MAGKDMAGRLIVIEGADGCGKTTQARLLAEYLREKGRNVILVREPGGTAIGEEIRKVLLNPQHHAMSAPTELLLFMACRSQLTSEVVKPALASGATVVCDRYLLSSVVYQGYARKLGVDIVNTIGAFATEDIKPDIQIVLDITLANALKRRSAIPDRLEGISEGFQRRVIQGYRIIAKDTDGIYILDGNRSIEEIQADIRRIVDRETP